MKRRDFLLAAGGATVMPGIALSRSPAERLSRKDSFFGLHFDLHPQANDTALGRDVSDELIGRLLIRVKPDYVQYDCKGHAGYLGYPSSVGTPSPGIVRDSLAIWRRVTARLHGLVIECRLTGENGWRRGFKRRTARRNRRDGS